MRRQIVLGLVVSSLVAGQGMCPAILVLPSARAQTAPSQPPPPPPRPATGTEESKKEPVPADPPSTRKEDDEASTPVDTARTEADRALRRQGLRRDGLVYVLDQEDEIDRLQTSLQLAANEMQAMTARMSQLVNQAGQIDLLLVGGQRELENAYAAAQFAAGQADLELQIARTAASTPSGSTSKTGTGTGGSTSTDTSTTTTRTITPERQMILLQEAEMRRQRIAYLETQVYQLQSQRLQLGMEYDRLNTGLMFKQAELDRGSLSITALADQIARRYDDLAAEPGVKEALRTLNQGVRKPYALGPRKDYKANVRAMAAELLEARRFVVEKGGKVVQLRAGKEEATLAYLARRFVDDLRKAQQRQADHVRAARSHESRIASLVAREARLSADLARAVSPSRDALVAELASVRKDLDRYRKDLAASDEARKALTRDLAEKREGFVQVVDALKKAGEIKQADEEATRGDAEVQAAIQKFKPSRKPTRSGSAPAGNKPVPPAELYARALHRVEVRLNPDKVALWVTATVNGQSGRRLVVDPTIESVRVSARFADEVHADIAQQGPETTATLSDGRSVRARRATLKSVEIGSLVATDVEALVLLDGYDGPPRLGASFFDRFVTRIEPDAARLTLTQVDLRALPTTPAPRGRAAPGPASGRLPSR
ncbi:MAG: aspartyl protease family protein [Isosphaeraceae bacterium]